MIIIKRVNVSQVFLDILPRINSRGASLEFTSKIVNLGLSLTSTLHWIDQVRYISMRVYTTLRSLHFHRRAFTRDLHKKLVESFHTLTTPLQSFNINATLSKSLEILLNACVRFFIGNIPFQAHVTPNRLALWWLSAKSRREYFTVMQAYKSLATSNPSYIETRFSRVGSHISLRHSERNPVQSIHCNFLRPEKANCSFKRAATNLLNGLNVSTYDMSELSRVKTRLYRTLLDRDTLDWQMRIVTEGIVLWGLLVIKPRWNTYLYL